MAGSSRVVVDGESFDIVREGSTTHITWATGPNPGYGFSIGGSAGSALSGEQVSSAIRGFLSGIDPRTGYQAE